VPEPGAGPWDEWHRGRDALERRSALPEVAVWRELALRHLGDVEGLSVLDCGSARGGFSRVLAERGAHVTAVDASAVAVELTRRQLQGAGEVVQADARRLPFDDDRFDAVVCLNTLNYVRPPQAVVSELVRVARPGGRLVATTLNSWSPLGASGALLARLGRNERAPGEAGISLRRLLRLLREGGVAVEAVEGAGHAVVVPKVTTLSLPWLQALPRSERIAFHVCVAGRV
jgi:2-polyprenyl-3-methyl-5-hydroxy-6-metoxy-1,4-benzoquinol methylase